MNNVEKMKQIIAYYGRRAQCVKAIEELAELQQELAKYINLKAPIAYDTTDMLEEIADVLVMVNQVIIMFEINQEVLEEKSVEKLDRTLERIETEKQHCNPIQKLTTLVEKMARLNHFVCKVEFIGSDYGRIAFYDQMVDTVNPTVEFGIALIAMFSDIGDQPTIKYVDYNSNQLITLHNSECDQDEYQTITTTAQGRYRDLLNEHTLDHMFDSFRLFLSTAI